jgi:hypothetical protein
MPDYSKGILVLTNSIDKAAAANKEIVTANTSIYLNLENNVRRRQLHNLLLRKNLISKEEANSCAVVGECYLSRKFTIYYFIDLTAYIAIFKLDEYNKEDFKTYKLRDFTEAERQQCIEDWAAVYAARDRVTKADSKYTVTDEAPVSYNTFEKL